MPALLPLSLSQQLGCEREAMMQHQREWLPPLPAALHTSPSPGHVMGYDHSCAAPHQDLIPLLPPSLCPQIPTTRLLKTPVLALLTSPPPQQSQRVFALIPQQVWCLSLLCPSLQPRSPAPRPPFRHFPYWHQNKVQGDKRRP